MSEQRTEAAIKRESQRLEARFCGSPLIKCRKAEVFEIAAHSNSTTYLERNSEIDSQLLRLRRQVIGNA
jgi:hypothetical protein